MKKLIIPLSIFLIFLAIAWTQFKMSRWNDGKVIIWDVIEYYSYLPALVHGDFTLRDSVLNRNFNYHGWAPEGPAGEKIIKMSGGIAVLYSPFFFTVYLSDILSGREINTYAPRYHQAVSLSAIFYLVLGLIILAKVLRKYFSPWAIAFTLVLLVLGTNLFHYSTAEPGMSHVFSFFLFASFLFMVERWYSSPSWRHTILLGLLFGLIILVRPTNGLIGVVFLFFGSRLGYRHLLQNWTKILSIGLLAFIVFFPQMLYWRGVSGSWLYFSYGEESFFFGRPNILEGLFSFRKGWFIYTPIMLFALAGLFTKSMPKAYRTAILVFLPLNIYLVLSWWCWWYGGSFGLRAFIESYALLSIPLAALIDATMRAKKLIRWTVLPVLGMLLLLNLFQSYQYKITLIHWDSMSWRAYRGVFMKLKFPADYARWLDEPDYENARKGLPE